MNRRDLLTGAPVTALAISAPRLLTASHAAATPATAMDTGDRNIMAGVQIAHKLLVGSLPEGAFLKGLQFTCTDNQINPDSVWASLYLDNELAHMRPALQEGWWVHGANRRRLG